MSELEIEIYDLFSGFHEHILQQNEKNYISFNHADFFFRQQFRSV